MASGVSRMQVATHVADNLASGRDEAVRSAAAWLVAGGHGRQARYLARDVAAILAGRGHVLAQVVTARPITDEARQAIEGFIKKATGARDVELVTSVDESIVGGLKVDLPSATIDASVRTKLDKFVEGIKL